MKPAGIQFFTFLAISIFCVTLPSALRASSDRESREVRISQVQGDVRLSRGDGKHVNLNQPWEEAEIGQPIEQGFALAAQKGTANIEFEDGSTIFLAENSLVLFPELSSSDIRTTTHITLPTGSAAFWLQLGENETFSIETPTDGIHFLDSHDYFFRVDAYLDSTAITPLGDSIDKITRRGVPNLGIPLGQTVFFRNGSIIRILKATANPANSPSAGLRPAAFADVPPLDALAHTFRDTRLPQVSLLPAIPSSPKSPEMGLAMAPQVQNSQLHPDFLPLASEDWNHFIEARVQEKKDAIAAALKASGLPSPIPGLAELHEHGSFFACDPYGTCWEPNQGQSKQAPEASPLPRQEQTPLLTSPNTNFNPQVVQWQETQLSGDACDFSTIYTTVSRTAHTPEELRELLRLKSRARSNVAFQSSLWSSCYQRNWIHHHGHYAMVLPPSPPRCLGKQCKPVVHPVHPPHPLLVRVGDRVGFVPRHPGDVKGKPPINLKNGIILAPAKPGEQPQRIAWNPSQKLPFVEQTPKEWNERIAPRPVLASAPEIRAHLTQETARGSSLSNAKLGNSQIVYDYRSQKFMMPAAAPSGGKAREVPIGGITSSGKVATFASERPGHYAESFARTTAAATYSGGGSSGSHSFGSHSYEDSSGASGGSSGGSSHGSSGGGSSSHSSSASAGAGGSGFSSRGSSSSGSSAAPAASASSSASGGGRPH
jgi:hypothetical protein